MRSNPTLNLKNMVLSKMVGTIKTELGDLDDFAVFLSRSAGPAAERRPTEEDDEPESELEACGRLAERLADL